MLTAEVITDELRAAFAADHGTGCSCCEPFPGGMSRLERELLVEARVAILRFDVDGSVAEDLEDVSHAAARDALEAARAAILARAIDRLAPAPERPQPVIVELDRATYRVSCHAETFDGIYRRQCTRPAAFLRDDLEVCRQHRRLESTRAFAG